MGSAVTVSDVDTPTASSLVITIPTFSPGDEYTFPGTPLLSITTESNSTYQVVTYSGTQPLQVYVDLMLTFSYRSSLDEPGRTTRGLNIQIFTPSDAMDGESLGSNVASTLIQVLPTNDNPPEFSQDSYGGRIAENSPAGTLVGVTVLAQDRDNSEGTSITFATSDPFFSVHSVNGEVRSLAPLDAEATPVYEFTVTASDNDGVASLTASVQVSIVVTDVNDEPPVFNQTLYSASAREDIPIGATLLTVSATDNDITAANSGVTYAIYASSGGSGSGDALVGPTTSSNPLQDLPFEVNAFTGEVTLTESLNFEAGVTLYEFTVQATDSGSPQLSSLSSVRIRVTDVNDNPPEFVNTLFSFSVEENTPFPSPVVSITARDMDTGAGGQIQYSLIGTTVFSINPTTGLLSLNGPLDFETIQIHTFAVVASDLGSPRLSTQVTVTISVENVNDNRPVFDQASYTFRVPENAAFSEFVVARDGDDDTITYRAVSGFVPGIQLDIFSGEISTAPGFSFDFEARRSYFLVLEAVDSSFSVAVNVSIVVLDANDLPPVFSQDVYMVDVDESLPIGASVLQVVAEDGDLTENAVIEYSLEPQGTFSIDQSTGVVSISGPLDFDAGPTTYMLNATARNSAPPNFEDSAAIYVSLLNANDIAPALTLDQLNVTFIENSDPVLLAPNLVVSDGDGPDHQLVLCTVMLTKACMSSEITPCVEVLSVNEELASQLDLSVSSLDGTSEQTLVVSGNDSELFYQTLLQTLEYSNPAAEPTAGERTVTVQCQDEEFSSNIIEIAIFVQLRNEFCPVVTVSSQEFNFTEGSASLQVGSLAQLVLSDEDSRPHDSLRALTITLSNRLDPSFESISVGNSAGLQVVSPPTDTVGSGDDMVSTTQTLVLRSQGLPQPIQVFQTALRSLTYTNTHPEPSVAPRLITIAPMDRAMNCTSVTLTVHVLPVNDNPPELVLSLGATLQYLEESRPLAFAAEAGLMVTDLDHNNLFPMQSATVVLHGILDGVGEMLQFGAPALPVAVTATSSQDGKW